MKPNIVIFATGGTIAGTASSQTELGYSSAQVGVVALLEAVPQLEQLANVRGEQIANIGSQDMDDTIWLQLAAAVNTELAKNDVDGVVITHGTDTIEETAYFLNLVVHSDKPIVMTAAMRPASALSADGPLNIYNAVAVAADPLAARRGVLVVINDEIHGARGMTKTSTTAVQAFKSSAGGLVGTSLYGENAYYRYPHPKHTAGSELSLAGAAALLRVDVIYISAGFSADMIDAAVERGAHGLIIAGVGNGNMSAAALAGVTRAIAKGVVVVRSTRVPTGPVGRNIEVNDDALNTVAAGQLNPGQARVLLKLVLQKLGPAGAVGVNGGESKDYIGLVQDYFDTY